MSDLDTPNAPAGWHRHGAGRQYWDGAHWLGEVQADDPQTGGPAGEANTWQPPAPSSGAVTAAGPVDEPIFPPPPPPSPQYGYPTQQYLPVYGYSAPPQYPYAQPQQQRRYNGFAISSFVLGLLLIYGIGSILALVFGYIGRRQIRDTGDNGGVGGHRWDRAGLARGGPDGAHDRRGGYVQ